MFGGSRAALVAAVSACLLGPLLFSGTAVAGPAQSVAGPDPARCGPGTWQLVDDAAVRAPGGARIGHAWLFARSVGVRTGFCGQFGLRPAYRSKRASLSRVVRATDEGRPPQGIGTSASAADPITPVRLLSDYSAATTGEFSVTYSGPVRGSVRLRGSLGTVR